ncbi:MAG: CRTAC1 family protein [Planctomycetota bacterium]
MIDRLLCLTVLPLAWGCGSETHETSPTPADDSLHEAWFQEQSRERGLIFQHRSGHEGMFYFPELMGGGVALFDMDGDGDLDVFLVQSGSLSGDGAPAAQHALFANQGDGTFVDVSATAGVATHGYGMGVAAGDYDGDGDVDLYVTNVGANVLLQNDGTGHFQDVTQAAGVGDESWGTSACFFDYDADGDFDLFVANYVGWSKDTEQDCFDPSGQPDYCSPTTYDAPTRDTLYRNEGDGTFTDISAAAGFGAAYGNGLGVVTGDFDGDGRLDLFVANDQTADQLWLNQGDDTFRDAAELRGCARDRNGSARAGMGTDTADLDDDGDLDILVVHLARETDGLFLNQGTHFREETARAGIGQADIQMTRFGVGFADFDNDGLLDIFVASGRVNLTMQPISSEDPYAEPNVLLRGVGPCRWEVSSSGGGTAHPLIATSRGVAFGDLDGDGAIDLVVVNRDGPAHLLMNRAPARGHWLLAKIVEYGAADALGASVTFSVGDRRVRRDVKPGYGYCTANDPRVHLGLGELARVDEVVVRWLDGTRESFGPRQADRTIVLRRGEGRVLR